MVIRKTHYSCHIDTRHSPSPEDIRRMQSYCRQDRVDALEFILDLPKTYSDWISGEKRNFHNAFAQSGGSVAGGLGAIFDDARQDLRREIQGPVDRTILSGIFSVGGTVATLPFAIIEMFDRASDHAPAGVFAVAASLVVQTGDGVVSGAGDLAKTVQDWRSGSLSGKSFDDIVYEAGKFGTKGYLFGKVVEGGIQGIRSLAKAVEVQPGPPMGPLTPAPVAAVTVPRVFIDAPREWVVRPILMAEDDIPRSGPVGGGSGKAPLPLGVARGAAKWWDSLWQKIGEWWATPSTFSEGVGPPIKPLRPDQSRLARLTGNGDVIPLKSRPRKLSRAEIVTQLETDLGVATGVAVWEQAFWERVLQKPDRVVHLDTKTGTLKTANGGYFPNIHVDCQASYVAFDFGGARLILKLEIFDGEVAVSLPYINRLNFVGQKLLSDQTLAARKAAVRALQEKMGEKASVYTTELGLRNGPDGNSVPVHFKIDAKSLGEQPVDVSVKLEPLTPADTAILTSWFHFTMGVGR